MKVTCPNCQKVIQAPDDWAGRKVKCPGCKNIIALPVPTEDESSPGMDLGSLGNIEDAGEVVIQERRRGKRMTVAEAEAARSADSDEEPAIADPSMRTCPKCSQKVHSEDIYVDIMCKHCGAAIPGAEIKNKDRTRYTGSMVDRMTTQISFYTGFTGAFVYPAPAMVWILLSMAIALGTIGLPLGAILGFTAGAGLNPISEKSDFGWVAIFLTVMFAAQGIYFSAVGYYVMIDTIRTTASGGEQPPSLTWNVANLGSALGGYAALLGFYALIVLLLVLSYNGHVPAALTDFQVLANPGSLIVLALLTFGVPMNMIGLSSSHALDGLNPVRVFRSIGRLAGHYIFLFLIVLLYLGIYIGVTVAVMSKAGPAIVNAANQGMKAGFLPMLGGPLAWSILIGMGFYFAYTIGRVLGLFCRTYKENLDFDL